MVVPYELGADVAPTVLSHHKYSERPVQAKVTHKLLWPQF